MGAFTQASDNDDDKATATVVASGVRDYDEITETEQNELSNAWLKIYEGLGVYERITGAENLDDIINAAIWEAVFYQKDGEE